jgi:hypothetical protein
LAAILTGPPLLNLKHVVLWNVQILPHGQSLPPPSEKVIRCGSTARLSSNA